MHLGSLDPTTLRAPLLGLGLLVALLACSESPPPPGLPDAGPGLDAGLLDAGPAQCGPGERSDGAGGCVGVGWRACGAGFRPAASGWGCDAILPPEGCGPGTFPVLGEEACQPIGTRGCSAGFEPDPSGWGCRAVLPPQACEGANRESLGSTACVPLGDCAAPFPPAEATHFVNRAFGPAQLDATHFARLDEALTAAPAGAVIAVEAGRYPEPLEIEGQVTLVGRCAEQVVLEGATRSRGILVSGAAADARISGVSVTNFDIGVLVSQGARLELSDSLVFANRSLGILVQKAGSSLQVRRSVTRGNLPDPATLKLGVGAAALSGGELVFEESASVGNATAGVMLQEAGTRVRIARSVIRAIEPNGLGAYGLGVYAVGGEVELEASAIEQVRFAGVGLQGTRGRIVGSVISGVSAGIDASGDGISACVRMEPGSVDIDDTTLAACERFGLHLTAGSEASVSDTLVRGIRKSATLAKTPVAIAVESGGALGLRGVALVDNAGSGLALQDGASLEIESSLVKGTRPLPGEPGTGIGISVRSGSSLVGTRLALVENAATALAVAGLDTRATVEGLVVADTRIAELVEVPTPHGIGITVVEASLTLTRGALLRSRGAALLLGLAGTEVTLRDVLLADTRLSGAGQNGSGIAVQYGPRLSGERVGVVGGHTAGIVSWGDSQVRLAESVVSGIRALESGEFGYGAIALGGTVELDEVALLDADRVGLLAAKSGTRATVRDSLIVGQGRESEGAHGHGVFVLDGAQAELVRLTVAGNRGVGAQFSGGAGVVDRCHFAQNTVALGVDRASSLREEPVAPQSVGDKEVVVTSDTVFEENLTRLGTGEVPLPSLPGEF